jgi:hypothetical protein
MEYEFYESRYGFPLECMNFYDKLTSYDVFELLSLVLDKKAEIYRQYRNDLDFNNTTRLLHSLEERLSNLYVNLLQQGR